VAGREGGEARLRGDELPAQAGQVGGQPGERDVALGSWVSASARGRRWARASSPARPTGSARRARTSARIRALQTLQPGRERRPLRGLAAELDVTPAQLALAWLLHRAGDIVPVPGTRSAEHVDENLAAADVQLDADTLALL
jgi:aryl-alcohol dehydrogenase-like predicted oxidoreductase